MPIVDILPLARAVRSTFPWSWHIWDRGGKSGFWSPCTQCCFFVLKEPTYTYAWLGQLFRFFFCSSSLKYMCNWAAHFHIWWCPGGVNAVKSKPIFQVLHHAASLGGFPKRMQNICVGMSKRKSLLPISWFHTAISVMKISEYCKEFSAFCGFGLLYIQYSPHWRGGFHKLQKLVFCLQNL